MLTSCVLQAAHGRVQRQLSQGAGGIQTGGDLADCSAKAAPGGPVQGGG